MDSAVASLGIQLLNDITQGIYLGNTLEEVFGLIYDRLREFVPYNRIAIAVVDDRKEALSILAARSDGKMVLNKGYMGRIRGSSLEPLIREGKTRVINDLQGYLERKPGSESTRLIVKEGMRSNLTLPLYVQGQIAGVMFFSSRQADAYKPEHEAFLKNIVGHMALALEKSRLKDALREKGDYLENVLQNSADAIVVCDTQNRISTWNEGARRMFGYEPDEILGRDYSVFVPAEVVASGEALRIKDLVERDGFLKDHECVRMTKDGRRLTVSVTSTLLRDARGKAIGRTSIVRDVTHLKELQHELVTSQSLAAVGELAATGAHEIKNPLAGISGAIQVLRDGFEPDDRRREVVAEVLEQITRLDNTVRDLLMFARPAIPMLQEVDLAQSLERTWGLLSQQPGAAEVSFRVEGAEGTNLRGDPQLLHQVWVNLFQNAVEAMPRGGTLLVRVSGRGPVRVEVRDDGHGIDRAGLARLFKPFFTTKTRGTGLGLAISKKIVEAHRGRVWAESEPRKGTSVFVEIPR